MKLFMFSFLCAINLPSLSLGLRCYTCSTDTTDIGLCTEGQIPELKHCPGGSCHLGEYLESRKPYSLGCLGSNYAASSCWTHRTTYPKDGILECYCVTDSCNTYDNRIQCYSCKGHVAQPNYDQRSRTDYKCKEGETPLIETKCPVDEQFGCMIRWEKESTIIGCHNNDPVMPDGCYGGRDSGGCYCSNNFCNTEHMKEQYREMLKPQPEMTTTTELQQGGGGIGGGGIGGGGIGGNTGETNSSPSSTSTMLIIGIFVLSVIVIL